MPSLSGITLCFINAMALFVSCHSITPSAVIEVVSSPNSNNAGVSAIKKKSIYASIANFGSDLPFGKPDLSALPVKLAPSNNPLLCEDVDTLDTTFASVDPIIILVPRGECSFERKARNAERLGAFHAIIYDNLATKYGEKVPYPQTLQDVNWPNKTVDYECQLGEGWIPMEELSFDKLPYDTTNDVLLSGSTSDGNLCAIYNDVEAKLSGDSFENFETKCPSKRCLLTSNRNVELIQACCAWDIYFDMGDDDTVIDVNITSTFLTMEEGDALVQMLRDGEVQAQVSLRWYPKFNISSLLICVLGTFITWLSGWISAKAYRKERSKVENNFDTYIEMPPRVQTDSSPAGTNVGDSSHSPVIVNNTSPPLESAIAEIPIASNETEGGANDDSSLRRTEQAEERIGSHEEEEEVLNLNSLHALIFIVAASSMLLILFYTKWYTVVTVFYVIGGVSSMIQVAIRPLLLFSCRSYRPLQNLSRPILRKLPFSVVDIISVLAGAGIGATWLWLWFSRRNNAHTLPFYWIVQDLMGACVCIAFLTVIRMNSIKVGTVLLVTAFVYDIFFVFITPHIFGESIMVTVATGGGQAQDPYYCEKYPSEGDCNNTPLPMLFAIPKINDWRGGLSMLGLGDIVIPGLICCFAARLDSAKHLANSRRAREQTERDGTGEIPNAEEKRACSSRLLSGYFSPIIMAYAIGLMLATIAVYLMKRGQPALLYIVPLTLCTMVLKGSINNELRDLWKGPGILVISEEVMPELDIDHNFA